MIAGLTRYATAGHIARAALEATAYQTLDVIEAMQRDSGIPISTLRVDGGMVVNALLMQFQADILDVPVVRPRTIETTALGAAYAAGLAVGYWRDTEDLLRNWAVQHTWTAADARGAAREADRLMAQGRHTLIRLDLTVHAPAFGETSLLTVPITLLPVYRAVLGTIAVVPAVIAVAATSVTAIAIAAISVTTARFNNAAGESKRKQCQRHQCHFHVDLHQVLSGLVPKCDRARQRDRRQTGSRSTSLGNANLKSHRYQDDWIETNDWLSAVKPIDPQYPHVIPVDPKVV